MKHDNGHTTEVIPGTARRSAVGGIEFQVRCCGEHEQSIHIQNPGRYTKDELVRLKEDHQHRIAKEHHDEVMALAFFSNTEQDIMECEHCK